MNISFDLDGTLIPYGKDFETEKRSTIAKLLGVEEIRKGTPYLISNLQSLGHKIHIYTTSFRSKRKIRKSLNYYGVKVNEIITQHENQQVLNSLNIHSSKFPPAFNFDIHIDDLKGVGIEAKNHNFKVIIIESNDKNWVEKIITTIKQIQNVNSI